MPRHTVYYIVPKAGVDFEGLLAYLNSDAAITWLEANCQRAASGFYRLQSTVLKQLPVPLELVPQILKRRKLVASGIKEETAPTSRGTLITAG